MSSTFYGPELILGTVQFGLDYGIANENGRPTGQEITGIADACLRWRIMRLDTAPAYGLSEETIGEVFTEGKGFSVGTKLPAFDQALGSDEVIADACESLESSIKRLRRSSLEWLLLHRGRDLQNPWGRHLWNRLKQWKNEGVVKEIGVSVYTLDDLPAWIIDAPPDIIQAPFNLLDQRIKHHIHFPRIVAAGSRIHARSVYLQGLLLMPPENLGSHFSPIMNGLHEFHKACRESGISPASAALDYVRRENWLSAIVIGMESVSQVEMNAQCFSSEPALFPIPPSLVCHSPSILNPFEWPKP